MIGRDRLICDLDERWDGPPPKCTGNTNNILIPFNLYIIFIKYVFFTVKFKNVMILR